MSKASNSSSPNPEDPLLAIAILVAEGKLALHDDRGLLVPREELIETLKARYARDIQQLIDNQLIVPVEQDQSGIPLYNILICFDFLSFLKRIEQAGFPLVFQQAIAAMYYDLFWQLCSDIEYEVMHFKQKYGREPNRRQLVYLRVLNEWAVSNVIIRTQDDILACKPEELDIIRKRAARWKKATLKGATLGYEEGEIEKIVKVVWRPPLQYFREREIKAFINPKGYRWTKEEGRLIWGGHFDFALCNEKGILCLAIDYQGTGHYGKTKDENRYANRRDAAKRSLCEKAGVPLIQLSTEYAFLANHQKLLQHFLVVFRSRRHDYALVAALLRERVRLDSSDSTLIDHRLANLLHRLDIYEMQANGKSILALLWELHQIETPFSSLPMMLDKLD